MTWQDELQQLDADLAAGRISAEDYRARRDAALGRAQAAQQGFPQQQPPQSGGFPQQGPPSGGFPQQGQNPFPPAFNWGQAAQQGDPNQQQPAGDANSTQVVNVNQVQQQPQQQQPPQQQFQQQEWPQQQNSWGQPQQQNAWGGAAASTSAPWDEPEAPEHGDTSWMRQGPEVFETSSGSGKGKWIGISLGAVLLIGVVVAGIFYFTSSSEPEAEPKPQQTGQEQPPPPPETPELPEPPAAKPAPAASGMEVLVPPPPGTPHAFNGLVDRPGLEGPRGGLLPPDVKDFALQNGMVDGWFHGTEGAEPKTTLIAIRMPDQNGAQALAEKYLDGQTGLAQVEDLSYQGVPTVGTGGGIFRTAYTSHNWAIILDVSGSQAPASRDLYRGLLEQQLTQAPPTVRE